MSPLPPRPEQTRIVRRPISANELEFLIPAAGLRTGPLLGLILWNAMAWLGFVAFLHGAIFKSGSLKAVGIMFLFVAVGAGFLWVTLKSGLESRLLCLNPTRISLRREILGRSKVSELPTREIVRVHLPEFYQRNYRPVRGISLETAQGKIRFGSDLRSEERDWLCGEIWKFVQPHAPGLAELQIPE